jgi:hypothetical protein
VSAAASVLQLRGVSKTYGQEPATVHALGGVDLSVQAVISRQPLD